MIAILPLRIDIAISRSRLIDAAIATAVARTAERVAASRPASGLDAPPPEPVITTIRSAS